MLAAQDFQKENYGKTLQNIFKNVSFNILLFTFGKNIYILYKIVLKIKIKASAFLYIKDINGNCSIKHTYFFQRTFQFTGVNIGCYSALSTLLNPIISEYFPVSMSYIFILENVKLVTVDIFVNIYYIFPYYTTLKSLLMIHREQ